jgi:hypothetical protein
VEDFMIKSSPAGIPLLVGAHGAEVEYGLYVVGVPSCTGKFEAFLDKGTWALSTSPEPMGKWASRAVQ